MSVLIPSILLASTLLPTPIHDFGRKHGCFNVDLGTYTVTDKYLNLRKGITSSMTLERIVPDDEPEPTVRLWD